MVLATRQLHQALLPTGRFSLGLLPGEAEKKSPPMAPLREGKERDEQRCAGFSPAQHWWKGGVR